MVRCLAVAGLVLLVGILAGSDAYSKSMLTEEELLLVEEMQQAGFSRDQINQVINIKVSVREANKKWTDEEIKKLDQQLRSCWQAMVKALASGDIETATSYFDRDMREIHKMLLSATTPQQRATLLHALENIKMLGVKGSSCAEYRINLPVETGILTYRGDLVFTRNDEGIWEIRSF